MSYTFIHGGKTRRMAYFLGDGIYPEWPLFVRQIHDAPAGPPTADTKLQEGVRKDVERLFGVVQGRFKVLRRESELWNVEDVVLVSEVCVILHNILIRIQQSSGFDEEIQVEDTTLDMIAQFIEEDTDRLRERGERKLYATQALGNRARHGDPNGGGVDFATLLTQVRVVKTLISDRAEHISMWEELVEMCALYRGKKRS